MIRTKEIPVIFKSRGKQIVGILHIPNKKKPPVLIMCHGWTGGKLGNSEFLFVKAARFFSRNGFAVLRFDHSGVGDSEGEFENYTTTSCLQEIRDAINFVRSHKEFSENIGLVGHSMGGMNAIISAAKDKKIKCVVSWAGVANHKLMWSHWMFDEVKRRKFIWLWGFKVTYRGLKEDFKWDTLKFAKILSAPILIINGDNDDVVRSSQARALFKSCKKPKKLLIMKDAGHGFSSEEQQKILFQESLNWFRRWLI